MNKWKTWTKLLACGTLILTGCIRELTAAEPVDPTFESSNQAYAQGGFDEAIQGYEKLLNNQKISPALLFNLGNAYYRKGDIARSILNYKRALLLSPSDPDTNANLDSAIKQAGLEAIPTPPWLKVLRQPSLDDWSWLGFCALLVSSLAWFIRGIWLNFFNPKTCPHRVFHALLAIGLLLVMLTATGMWAQSGALDEAVVMTGNSPVLVSPFDSADKVASLPAGETVHPIKEYGRFVYVEKGSGLKGWISLDSLESVLPKS